MARVTPDVPLKIVDLEWGWGIEFKCQACGRRRGYDKNDLLQLWGETGRTRDIAAKHRCTNCTAKNPNRRPGVRVIVFKTESHTLKALNRTPVDRLVRAIGDLVVKRKISGDLKAKGDAAELLNLPDHVVELRRDREGD